MKTPPASSPGRSIQLALAGEATLCVSGDPPLSLGTLDAALLAWLALEGPTPRGRLVALLWPDSDADAARNNLRQRIFRLHKLAGTEVVSGTATLALAAHVEHDLDDADDLLPAQEAEIGGEFALWLAQQRERRRDRVRHALVDLADMAERAGEHAEALVHAHELLALEPLREEAHRRVMRLHYLRGDRATALLAFDQCEQILKDEVGVRPGVETLALLNLIEQQSEKPAAALVPGVAGPPSLLRPPRLIGRGTAWSQLEGLWSAGQAAVVVGAAGMGKSRLLTDFARSKHHGSIVTGARPGDARVAFASLSRLLRLLPSAKLLGLGAATQRELARLLPELGSAAPDAAPHETARFQNAIAEALGSAGVQAIVFDDLQFADDASLQVLQAVAPGSALHWLFGVRPEEGSATLRAWVGAAAPEGGGPATVPLAPFSAEDIVELLHSLGLALDADRSAALWRRTGGNPMFVLETLRALGEQSDGMASTDWPAAPSQLALIGRRITSLSSEAVALARCAAIAMPDFSIDLACEVLGQRTLALADPLAELERAQVLADGVFVHDLVYEAALASVPAAVAQRLHGEIAHFLERHDAEPARLAAHWDHAHKWEPAAQHYLRAAERAMQASQPLTQAELLGQAARCWELAGNAAARFEALLQRATVMADTDRGPHTQQAMDELIASVRVPRERLSALAAQFSWATTRSEHARNQTLERAPDAIALARELGDREAEARLSISLCDALGDQHRSVEALATLEPLREWVMQHAPAQLRWDYAMTRAIALEGAGRLRDAAAEWSVCESLARQSGRNDLLARSLACAGWTEAKVGRVLRAITLFDQARALDTSDGTGGAVLRMQTQSAYAHRLRDVGRYAEALALFEECQATFEAAGVSNFDLLSNQIRLAVLFIHLGQPARTTALLKTDYTDVPPGLRAYQLILRAEAADASRAATPQDTRARVEEALALVPEPDNPFRRACSMFAARVAEPAQAEILGAGLAAWAVVRERFSFALPGHVIAAGGALAQGAADRALPHVEAMLHLARDYQGEAFYQAETWLVAAQVYEALGRTAEARAMLDTGLQWARHVHDTQVPAPFRESFLQRNPVNRGLLAMAARLAP